MSVVDALTGGVEGDRVCGSGVDAGGDGVGFGASSLTTAELCDVEEHVREGLADVMREIRSLAPPRKENDGVTDIARKRDERLARGSAAPASSRS
jgi:hypothetical protein